MPRRSSPVRALARAALAASIVAAVLAFALGPIAAADDDAPLKTAAGYVARGDDKQFGDDDLAGALADYSRAIALDPRYADAYAARGGVRAIRGDRDGAMADFDKAIELAPRRARFYVGRSRLWGDKGDFDRAIRDCDRALALDPGSADAFGRRGDAKHAKGDHDGAIADYGRAIQLSVGEEAWTFFGRALARKAKGDAVGAAADFRKASALDPDLAVRRLRGAHAADEKGDLADAIAAYTDVIDLVPDVAAVYVSRAMARSRAGDHDGAIADCTKAMELDPTSSAGPDVRAIAKHHKGDFEGAIADFTRAIALDPKNAIRYHERGISKESAGDLDGAISDYTQALALDPKLGSAYLPRGVCRRARGDRAGAIADLAKAVELEPNHGFLRLLLGATRFDHGELAEGLRDLRAALDRIHDDAVADKARAYIYVVRSLLGRRAEAKAELVAYMSALPPDRQSSWPVMTLRCLAADITAENLRVAAETSAPAVRVARQCEALFWSGMRHWLDGEDVAARESLTRCLATRQRAPMEHQSAEAFLARWPERTAPASAPAPAPPSSGPAPSTPSAPRSKWGAPPAPAPPAAPPAPPPAASAVEAFLAGWAVAVGGETDATTGFPRRIRRVEDLGEMVLIPAGTFQMGAVPGDESAQDDEKPRRAVTLTRAYYFDVNEVTEGQWARYRSSAGADEPAGAPRDESSTWPIARVRHGEATAFATWAGASLPTEAQWERAAKGGHDEFVFPWGVTDIVSRRNGRAGLRLPPKARVRSYPPNDFGVYDVAGSVAEWCADWYQADLYAAGPASDPSGPASGTLRVVRGGSRGDTTFTQIRTSARSGVEPDDASGFRGFRCARAIPDTAR